MHSLPTNLQATKCVIWRRTEASYFLGRDCPPQHLPHFDHTAPAPSKLFSSNIPALNTCISSLCLLFVLLIQGMHKITAILMTLGVLHGHSPIASLFKWG